jgi:hypothetical protein
MSPFKFIFVVETGTQKYIAKIADRGWFLLVKLVLNELLDNCILNVIN